MNALIDVCTKLRIILETLETFPVGFEWLAAFPNGCCGTVSRALGGYLTSLGYKGINYVCGYRNEVSHAWLEYNNCVIDITADQFFDCTDSIIISDTDPFHKVFINITKRPISIEDMQYNAESWIISKYKDKYK